MIFTEDIHSFSFNTVPFESEAEFDTSLWLLLVGINEIPPHIALISDGKYYSLSTKKVDCGSSAEVFVNKLNRKKIPTLFVKIQSQTPKRDLQDIYKDLQPLTNSDKTCLSPIKDFFSEQISQKFKDLNYVFEMLALLENKGLLQKCISLNCDSSGSNRITLPKYNMAQIRNRINALSISITSTKHPI